jgi:hypothetical protein
MYKVVDSRGNETVVEVPQYHRGQVLEKACKQLYGIEYTIEEAMQIADWIIDQWDHLIRYESVMLMTHENADLPDK